MTFWKNEGEKTTLEALKRKRQKISDAFRKLHESKYKRKDESKVKLKTNRLLMTRI